MDILKLQIHPVATRILEILMDEYSFDDSNLHSSAWYNGRERGICLYLTTGNIITGTKTLIITFGEHRNSDEIFVDHWYSKEIFFLNPPTVQDFTDKAYQNRMYFNCNKTDEAVQYIMCIFNLKTT